MSRANELAAVAEALGHYRIWLRRAAPGDIYTYHVGLLSEDRIDTTHVVGEILPDGSLELERLYRPVEPFNSLATLVLEDATEHHYIILVQHRIGPATYRYLAIRTSKEFPIG